MHSAHPSTYTATTPTAWARATRAGIQIFSESAQEAYDNTIQAFRIAEHKDVLTPTMVTLDGFILSHTMEVLNVIPDDEVKKFIGEYKPEHYLLDRKNQLTVGAARPAAALLRAQTPADRRP